MPSLPFRDPDSPPRQLVEPGQTSPCLGRWSRPVPEPNLEEAAIPHLWDWLPARMERGISRRWRNKRWQFVNCATPGWVLSCAIADAAIAGNVFVYAVNTRSGAIHRLLHMRPLAAGVRVEAGSSESEHRFDGGRTSMRIANHGGGRHFALQGRGRFDAGGGAFEIDLQFESEPGDRHAALSVPLPEGRWNYTHKFGGFRVRGVAQLGGETVRFDPALSLGASDYTRLAALRHTVWRWVSLATVLPDGRRFALNLVQPTPGEAAGLATENMLWIEGQPEQVRNASLQVDGLGWRVQGDGLQLVMRPLALYRQQLRVPLLAHRLDHHVGAWSGFAETSQGRIELRDVFGLGEDNDSWW
ncbi:MAG: DUF2804 family protein [Burkholderiales bacterium]|nr:DUF2804 family protein [Burkholderiales bacterium]